MDRPSAIYESEKQLKALADVLEGKEYKNTGATRGESKWLKYIAELMEKNQLFGIKMTETEIMPEQTFTFIDREGVRVFEGSVTLNGYDIVLGEIYDVKFDDILYKIECRNLDNTPILGNASIAGVPGYYDTGEPFLIAPFFNTGGAIVYIYTTLEAGNHTISINGLARTIIKIPKMFLPDDIGGGSSVQSDWNQTDTTASDYIKNKPTISEQVQTDWNQTNIYDKSYIKNKPNVIGAKGTGLYSEIFNYPSNHMNKNTASGEASHAEGMATTASGKYSHAEGMKTKAEGYQSHSEGFKTTAKGDHSHAEGSLTSATRTGAHAEGLWTIASSVYQHVQGQYNIEDTTGTYAHIVGNGTKEASRSNAHTLDWNGNAWYAGTVEGTAMIVKSSTEGSSKRFKITVDDSGVITATEITA